MRTLKRTLCLVLSLVMVLGLFAIHASAAIDYSDTETITYAEAVDVLSGIGVLKGYPDGTFQPTKSVSRAEAAKIIAYLLIGDATAADALKANADPFDDVSVNHWAAGYIAYCAQRNIIVGRGNGIFDPDGNVTGIEFVKMLLCAIGYGANSEYANGDTWEINVAKDGVQYGIFEGNLAGVDNTKAATREECALYAFNTMFLSKVTYAPLYGGYIENVASANNAESNKKSSIANDYQIWRRVSSDDEYGRPTGYYWVQYRANNRISGSYGAEDWLYATYNTPVTGTMLNEAFGSAAQSTAFTIYENGADYYGYTYLNEATGKYVHDDGTIDIVGATKTEFTDLRQVSRANTNVLAHTGYGVTTEVYLITDEHGLLDEIRIVLVHNYLGQVATVKKATNLTDAYVTVNLPENIELYTGADVSKVITKVETDEYAKNEYVLFNYSARTGAIDITGTAEVISSRITSWKNAASGLTIGANGTTYNAAKDDFVMKNQTRAQDIDYKRVNSTTYTLFADWNGDIIGMDAVSVSKNFVYVSEFGFRRTTGEDDVTESQALTVAYYDAEGNRQVKFLDTNSEVPGYSYRLDGKGNKIYDLAEAWDLANLNDGERSFVETLNKTLAGNLYFFKLNSKGEVVLTDLETLAASQATPTKTGDVEAFGENAATPTTVFRGVTGMRTVKNVKASETNSDRDTYELQAGAKTLFFYLNASTGKIDVYNGISNVPGGKSGVKGAVSWYAEAEYDTMKTNNAYAEVVLVSYTPEATVDELEGPAYVYINNGRLEYPGDYKKIDNEDGTWSVEFYVTSVDGEAKVFSYDYKTEAKANAAIVTAAAMVTSEPAAWVVDGGTGLAQFAEPDQEVYSKVDKLYFVGATEIKQVEETTDGVTLFYEATFKDTFEGGSGETTHQKGVELTDAELIVNFTNLPVAEVTDLIDYAGQFRAVLAFDDNLIVKAVFLL